MIDDKTIAIIKAAIYGGYNLKEIAKFIGVNYNTLRRVCSDNKISSKGFDFGSQYIQGENILLLGDMHVPFHDIKAIRWAASLVDKYNITKVIQLGDITDGYAWSRWAKDPDAMSPSLEHERVISGMEEIHELFPNMTILLGNHDTRLMAKAFEAGIPSELIRDLASIFPYNGWQWHTARGTPYIHNGIAYMHGDEVQGGMNAALAAERLGMSVCYGHTHQARLLYSQSTLAARFGMQCGCLIDVNTYAMRYSKLSASKVWKGVGLILDGVPSLLPYRP